MPLYHLLLKHPDGTDGEMADAEFRNDAIAIDDARRALAAMAHEAAQEGRKLDDVIEVLNEVGTVIAVVALESGR
jgi:hypothetical protein